MTNREKLMQMSDEELAKWICNQSDACDKCDHCPGKKYMMKCFVKGHNGEAALIWLREEVDNERK